MTTVGSAMRRLSGRASRVRLGAVACLLVASATALAEAGSLKVKVLKACPDCVLPSAPGPCQAVSKHYDRAAQWTPTKNIKIHAVSIPEQSDIALYADIEISTAPEMYRPDGHIFRVKYAGPGIVPDPPCPGVKAYVGSNITTTNIAFPAGTWIAVPAGTPVYVHLDIKNSSVQQIDHMTQDVYIYYSE